MSVESCNPEDIQLYHRVQADQQKQMDRDFQDLSYLSLLPRLYQKTAGP